jgi:hypothetical protein
METKRSWRDALAACLLLGLAGTVTAAPVYWTDWTWARRGAPGTVIGNAAVPGIGSVGVTYTGEVVFADVDGTGPNYWAPFPATYADGAQVDNGPVQSDVIGLFLGGGGPCTITFSQPVVNPVMAVVSLGGNGLAASCAFDVPFNIVAKGPGYFGNGLLSEEMHTTLQGKEGNGTIQFFGPVLTLQWTIPMGEYWYGFTVGVPGVGGEPSEVPAPGTLLLVSIGTAAIGYLRRRRAL